MIQKVSTFDLFEFGERWFIILYSVCPYSMIGLDWNHVNLSIIIISTERLRAPS